MKVRSLGALVLLAVLAPGLAAQGTGELELRRLPSAVRIDGAVTDSAWDRIRVAYDEEYLYASGRFYDSRPEGIRINSLYRDRWSGDDTFALFAT